MRARHRARSCVECWRSFASISCPEGRRRDPSTDRWTVTFSGGWLPDGYIVEKVQVVCSLSHARKPCRRVAGSGELRRPIGPRKRRSVYLCFHHRAGGHSVETAGKGWIRTLGPPLDSATSGI